MQLSSLCQYAVRAAVSLARHNATGQPVTGAVLSEETGIPLNYVPQVMAELRRANLAESLRGASGGYRLARSPESVSVGDVVRSVNGPLVSVDCLPEGSCRFEAEGCALKKVWSELDAVISRVLDSKKLSDISSNCPEGAHYVI
jgi:Rrf2 family transcriptional regulator, cysteine metabolism repressor